MCEWEAKVGQCFSHNTEGVRCFAGEAGKFFLWGLKRHNLTGKPSQKHAFLDMTRGHDEEMTEFD